LASLGSKDGSSFADAMIERFDLSGDSADAVHAAFAAPASGTSVTIAGILLVVFSALSFSRTLQRVFELTWNLPRRGMRGTMAGLRWLALVVVYFALHPLLGGALHGLIGVVASLSGTFVLWLLTPYLLLDGRVPWRRLVPQAALCAVGVTVLGVGCAIYVPHAMSTSAEEFGAIGVAFTLLSVLWAGGFVIVGAAAIGSLDWRPSSSTGDAPTLAGAPSSAP
jgi:membrane protein